MKKKSGDGMKASVSQGNVRILRMDLSYARFFPALTPTPTAGVMGGGCEPLALHPRVGVAVGGAGEFLKCV